ncbi:MAG: hypothetical protein ACUVUF_06980 [Candidatus Bathycorpusculaceae bacterium]
MKKKNESVKVETKTAKQLLGVSEGQVKQEETIQADFKTAKEIYDGIVKQFKRTDAELPTTLFALCLIYARMLTHHLKKEFFEKHEATPAEALAKTLSTFNDEILLLKSKLQEHKHKLHQILDELSIWTPEKIEQHLSAFLNKDLRDLCWRTEQFVRVVDLQKKFEELLEK